MRMRNKVCALVLSVALCAGKMCIRDRIMDPRERPADAAQKADQAHAQWKDEDLSLIHI